MDLPLMRDSLSSRAILPLQNFCYCLSLTSGVRVITVLTLVCGAAYILLSGELLDGEDLTDVIVISCQITGVMFFSWFLTLLLLQSLNMKLPRKLATWIGLVLTIWLLMLSVFFIIMLCIYGFGEDQESINILITILSCFFGSLFTAYSVWVIMSFVRGSQEQSRLPSSSRMEISGMYTQVLHRPSTAQHFSPSVSKKISYISSQNRQRTKYFFNEPKNLPETIQSVEMTSSAKFAQDDDEEKRSTPQPMVVIEDQRKYAKSQKPLEDYRAQQPEPSSSLQLQPSTSLPQ